MPDITMCMNNECKKCTSCYRFMAKPWEYGQSYFMGLLDEKGKCEYYWKMAKGEKRGKK